MRLGYLTVYFVFIAICPGSTDQYTLHSEYIRRYLGELTPMQESRLLQLRKWIADLQKGKVHVFKFRSKLAILYLV